MRFPTTARALIATSSLLGALSCTWIGADDLQERLSKLRDTASTDTESDTDTDSDGDADSDADSDADTDTLSVDALVPAHGTSAGGDRIAILGAGLDDKSLRVTFASHDAPVVERSAEQAIVLSPAIDYEGAVDVRIETDSKIVSLDNAFHYYTDTSGAGVALGQLAFIQYTGDYLTALDNRIEALFAFVEPTTLESWQWTAPAIDECVHEDTYEAPTPTVLATGASRALLVSDEGAELEVPLESRTNYFSAEFPAESLGSSYDLSSFESEIWPVFDVPSIVEIPDDFEVSSPYLDTPTPPAVRQDSLNLTWEGRAEDLVLLQMMLVEPGSGDTIESLSCVIEDDGEFSVSSENWTAWESGKLFYLAVGRVQSSTAVHPVTHGELRLQGVRYKIGVAFTN